MAAAEQKELSVSDLLTRIRRARLAIRLTFKPENAINAVADALTDLQGFQTVLNEATFNYKRNTLSGTAENEMIRLNEASLRVTDAVNQLATAVLSSRHRAEIAAFFGKDLLLLWERFSRISRPELFEERLNQNRLVRQYLKLIGGLSVNLRGRNYPLAGLSPFLESHERQTRLEVHQLQEKLLLNRAGELDELFDELFAGRSRLALRSGFKNFSQIAYLNRHSPDLNAENFKTLQETIFNYLVPVTREIRRLQQKRLKLDHIYYYDLPCWFSQGNPAPAEKEGLLDAVDLTMDQLFGPSGFSLAALAAAGHIDLKAQVGKYPANAVFVLPQAEKLYLMANHGGGFDDLRELIALAGLARVYGPLLQKENSFFQPDPVGTAFYREAPLFLLLTRLNVPLTVHRDEYAALILSEALLRLVELCLVDSFEHEVYHNPEMAVLQRNRLWSILEKKYLPDRDLSASPFLKTGRGWQLYTDLAEVPFSAGSQMIGLIAALDLWRESLIGPQAADQKFMKLVQGAGQGAFLEQLEACDNAGALDPDTIKRVAYAVCKTLGL